MSRRAPFLRLALPVTLGLAPFFACNVYDESLLGSALDAAASSSGELVGGRGIGYWSGPGQFACQSAGKPTFADKPAPAPDPDGKNEPDIVVALRRIDLGTTDPVDGGAATDQWKRLGFDVDGLCTGSSQTCAQSGGPACAPRQGQIAIDGEYCRDNSFGNLATTLTYASSLTSSFGFGAFDCALCVGSFNFLVRIQGYNGEPNDDTVDVDFFPSTGLVTPTPFDCKDPDLPDSACFVPGAPWKIDRSVIVGADAATSISTLRGVQAFVKNGYVTIILPPAGFPITFPGSDALIRPFPVTVHQGFITGRLKRQPDATWHVEDGMIGGSTTLGEVLDSLVGIGVCPGTTEYVAAQTTIDNVADVLGTGEIAPGTPCDSVSVGIGFTAYQATLGPPDQGQIHDYCTPSSASDAGTDGGFR